MLSTVLVRGGELLAAVVVLGAMLAGLAWMGVAWLRRKVRRRLRSLAMTVAGQAWRQVSSSSGPSHGTGSSGWGSAPLRQVAGRVLARSARP